MDGGSTPPGSTNFIMNADNWHIPLRNDKMTILSALKSMESFKLQQTEVPFIIRLFEHPKYNILPGAVTLDNHDIIHILLGRGLLPKDEAFVIGFTMGTTKALTTIDTAIFKFVTRFLYPAGYRFGKEEHKIFHNGVNCAHRMDCPDFSKLDLTQYFNYNIKEARKELKINTDELVEEYIIESMCYENSPESQRLLWISKY